MSLGCARCGACCENIWLSRQHRGQIEAAIARDDFESAGPEAHPNSSFILEHWTEVERTEDGESRYVCDAYDPDRRLCTAHADRPPVCSQFPWYGRQAGDLAGAVINKRCSYWLDVPPAERPPGARPLIPITVV